MKRIIGIIIFITISISVFGQNYKDQRGIIRMLYGTPQDTAIINFSSDSVLFEGSQKAYKFETGIVVDSIKMNGLWYKTLVPSQWTTFEDGIRYTGDSVNITGDLLVTGNVTIGERLIHNMYETAAYIHPDSTITTSASTDWAYMGGGANNKFTNIYNEGFSFDGDTLQFSQESYDTRDSVEFRLAYSGSTATTNVNKTVTYGIFIKNALGTSYHEIPQCSRKVRTSTAGIYYNGATCTNIPIYLKNGDKIQIRLKIATSTTTVLTDDFGIYLNEE